MTHPSPVRLIAGILFLATGLHPLHATTPPPLISGQPVRVGTPGFHGPLSVGLNNHPVAAVNLSGGARPDLFLVAGNHSNQPGLYLARYSGDTPEGAPVFATPEKIPHAGGGRYPVPRHIWQDPATGKIHAFWLAERNLLRTTFDPAAKRFIRAADPLPLPETPGGIANFTVVTLPDGTFTLFFAVGDGTRRHPADGIDSRDPAYRPYDGALIYRGGLGYHRLLAAALSSLDAPATSPARLATKTEREALMGYGGLTEVRLAPDARPSLLTGSRFGNLLHYPLESALALADRALVAGPDGIALRHPTINPHPLAYPSANGLLCDLIVGGEGGLHYYAYARQTAATGAPIYRDPLAVLEENAPLYAGTLPVLSVADWNSDGTLDLVSGNSEGKVLLFANQGSDRAPAFAAPVELHANGEPIHIQQGYVAVQGPGEQRWGYSCPRAFDWNDDGRPDLVMSSATARHEVFLNLGAPTAPLLDRPRLLYSDGLSLHGTWRVQPAVARIGNRVAYIHLDAGDELRLHWKIDDHNLADAGKLRMEDGSAIRANFLSAGGTGRLKLQLVDWDLDGTLDLIIGTPRHASVPNPENGLPRSQGLKGAAVLFMKNTGTNDAPVFAFPTMMKFRGQTIYHDQHACGPVATELGAPAGPNLFVGSQDGRIYYYARADLSWD